MDALQPLTIRMHDRDNVAIVANEGGLPPGTVLASGLVLCERVPQGHKVALTDIAAGAPVLRYGIPIGHATKAIPAGSWVHERLLQMPEARGLDGLPIATVKPAPQPALDGYTFEGYRNPDGSVGTRNILAITTTVQELSTHGKIQIFAPLKALRRRFLQTFHNDLRELRIEASSNFTWILRIKMNYFIENRARVLTSKGKDGCASFVH